MITFRIRVNFSFLYSLMSSFTAAEHKAGEEEQVGEEGLKKGWEVKQKQFASQQYIKKQSLNTLKCSVLPFSLPNASQYCNLLFKAFKRKYREPSLNNPGGFSRLYP